MLLRLLRNWVALACITALVSACGGGSGGGNSTNAAPSSSNGGSNSPGTSAGGGSTPTPTTPTTPTTPAPTPTPLNYAVQLSWTPPSTRADDSPLSATELSGYRIYYALESDSSQDTVVPVSGGSSNSLRVTLNTAGNYTFAITAVDQNGLESSLSAPVSVAVN